MKHLINRLRLPGLCLGLSLLTTGLGAQTLENFTLNWSSGTAVATGSITLDTSQFGTSATSAAPGVPFGTAITALSVTVSGASDGNGPFGITDFTGYTWRISSPVDFTQQIVGQSGFINFNLFGTAPSPTATGQKLILTTDGGLGDAMMLTSFAHAATHWLGNTDSTWTGANWASDASGTATAAAPTANDDITFAATGAQNQVNTTLDADFTIKSLTVNSTTGISGSKTLTVNETTTLNALLSVNSGVTLVSNGAFTVAAAGALAGAGTVQMAMDQNLNVNGMLVVGDPSATPGASVLSVTTSGTGSVVMGANSVIGVTLWTGAGMGDNTGIPTASDRLNLTGKLDATAGGTLALGNANTTHVAGGDQWKVINLNSGPGSILGKLAINDSSLQLTPTQVGNFNQNTGVYTVIDVNSGLQMAGALEQSLINGMQGMLGDINNRLFRLRAGGGEEESDGSISASMDLGVVIGQGDGDKNPIARQGLRSRQWEVFTTVNYANIGISSIRNQAGVNSQTWAPGVGIERHFSRHITVGFAASLMETHQTYSGGLGWMDMQGVALSAYASYVNRAFWSDILYSFGTFDLNTTRNPGGFPGALGNTSAYTNAIQFNTGWNFRYGRFVTGPFAGVDYLNVHVDGYSETGGGLAALAYNTRSLDSLITRIGWSASQQIDTDWAVITPQLRLSYERQNVRSNNGTSVNLINQPFSATTTSQHPGQDYLVAGFGVNFQFSPAFSMLLNYQGQFFRDNMQAHYGSVRFGYKF